MFPQRREASSKYAKRIPSSDQPIDVYEFDPDFSEKFYHSIGIPRISKISSMVMQRPSGISSARSLALSVNRYRLSTE